MVDKQEHGQGQEIAKLQAAAALLRWVKERLQRSAAELTVGEGVDKPGAGADER